MLRVPIGATWLRGVVGQRCAWTKVPLLPPGRGQLTFQCVSGF